MPKMKTHKGLRKRLIVRKKSGRSSFQQKATSQDHFNARERGKTTRSKRRLNSVSETRLAAVRRMLPYNGKKA